MIAGQLVALSRQKLVPYSQDPVLKQAQQVSETANALNGGSQGTERKLGARAQGPVAGSIPEVSRKEIPCALAAGRRITYIAQLRLGSAALPL